FQEVASSDQFIVYWVRPSKYTFSACPKFRSKDHFVVIVDTLAGLFESKRTTIICHGYESPSVSNENPRPYTDQARGKTYLAFSICRKRKMNKLVKNCIQCCNGTNGPTFTEKDSFAPRT